MAGEPNAGAGGGDAGSLKGGGQPGGEQQKPGAGAGGQGGGAGQPGGNEGGAGKPLGLNPEILPPDLRNKSEAELKFILSSMPGALKKLSDENQRLKQQVQGSGKGPTRDGVRFSGRDDDEGGEDKKNQKPLEERILEDPEGVIDEVVRKRYGGVIQGLDQRTSRSELNAARQQLDDFQEYEQEVLEILEEAGAPKTFENMAGAYTMVIGQRTLEEKRRNQQQAAGMEQGGGTPPDESSKKPKLTDLEREVARAHGMSEEEWASQRDNDVTDSIRVPDGTRRQKESA